MPYKHKNGCTCMTMPEFLTAEGEREGKSGADVWDEIVEDMGQSDREDEQYMKDHPNDYFEELRLSCEDDDDGPTPVEILEVLEAHVSSTLRGGKTKAVVLVKCKDGKTRKATMYHEDWSGSFYDPPEEDSWIEWEKAEISS